MLHWNQIMSFLVIERGSNQGKRLQIVDFPISIGRDPGNHIVLEDDEVSRFHFRIKKRGNLHILEDLESKNGTYLNGDKIINAQLRTSDKILVGSTEMVFLTSNANINITQDTDHLNQDLAQALGMQSPIELPDNIVDSQIKPVRMDPNELAMRIHGHPELIKKIYEYHDYLLVLPTLEELSKAVLKFISQLIPTAQRATIFSWNDSSRKLTPISYKEYQQGGSFKIDRSVLEDVVARRQGINLIDTNKLTDRIILPMVHNEETICILHLEKIANPENCIDLPVCALQALLTKSGPTFESHMLRTEIEGWMFGMIETLINTVEAKDTYTRGHSERVSKYSMAMANELRLSKELKRLLLISSLCHDIGKIGVPDAILKKASILSTEEYNEMKLHPIIGAEIVSHMPNAHRFVSGIKYHHEKWDGTGYPEGLIGEDIPFFGRIVAVADVFDAMVSGRSYSGFIDQQDAVERLDNEKELFDPEILKAFHRAWESGAITLKTSTLNQDLPEEEIIDASKQSPLSKKITP